MSEDVNINRNNLDSKEQNRVEKQLEEAVKQLQANPEEFLKKLKSFTI